MAVPTDRVVYLDYNATTPLRQDVVGVMADVMSARYGNPSSLHALGRAGRALLEESRESILRAIGGQHGELIFTSGGSEANALALLGACLGNGDQPPRHLVVSGVEHPSILEVAASLEKRHNLTVTRIFPDSSGRIAPSVVEAAIRPGTTLVSLQQANNETGVTQDVEGVAAVCQSAGVLYHCDAVQALGKIPLSLGEPGPDLVSVSAHKVYGPRGVGALWKRAGARLDHPWGGGPQEKGARPGTEDLPGIAGFARAVTLLEPPRPTLRDRLWERLQRDCPNVERNGSADAVVPNTLNVSFAGVRAELLLIRLDMEGVHASSGSACSSGAREPSHVLQAMGFSEERVRSAVRFSLGVGLGQDDIDRATEVVARCVRALRDGSSQQSGVSDLS